MIRCFFRKVFLIQEVKIPDIDINQEKFRESHRRYLKSLRKELNYCISTDEEEEDDSQMRAYIEQSA